MRRAPPVQVKPPPRQQLLGNPSRNFRHKNLKLQPITTAVWNSSNNLRENNFELNNWLQLNLRDKQLKPRTTENNCLTACQLKTNLSLFSKLYFRKRFSQSSSLVNCQFVNHLEVFVTRKSRTDTKHLGSLADFSDVLMTQESGGFRGR